MESQTINQKAVVRRIIDLREARDWTQKDLADRMGMNKVTMNKIENGKRALTNDELASLASLFDVTTDYLLGVNNTPKWATPKQVTDLKQWLDDPEAMDGFSFGGSELTDEEKDKLKMSMTQIFWDRLNLKRMPLKRDEGGDNK